MSKIVTAIANWIEPYIPVDKQMHLCVGVGVGALVWALLFGARAIAGSFFGAHPLFFGILVAGVVVHAAKESEDRLDNLLEYHAGLAPIHGVDLLDFVAGLTGTLVVDVVFLWLGWV